MRKLIFTTCIFTCSLVLFSFGKNEALVPTFNEIKVAGGDDSGFTSWTQYEQSQLTADQQTWNRRYVKWEIGPSSTLVDKIEMSLHRN